MLLDQINAELHEAIRASKEVGPTEQLVELISYLTRRVFNAPGFSYLTDRDPLIANAIHACMANYDKFDAAKGQTPFAYIVGTAKASINHQLWLKKMELGEQVKKAAYEHSVQGSTTTS